MCKEYSKKFLFQGSFAAREMKAYSEAGSVAEEVLSNITTVIAFGGQQKEVQRSAKG